ncbi:MAG: YigZ family protein [Alistipes sp.]|jgi:putative IMPACT (imprinted ancient) family translation regulator|nr:YigZ family protein [Alistipes sp.]
MTENEGYKTIEAPAKAAIKERGSRFHAFAYPVTTESEAKEWLRKLRAEFPDATHICYAYRLGPRGDIWAASDNGEPGGSAGRPIHGRLLSARVTDCMVVVVRWFGGKKLGVPGLIAAYKEAAAEALEAAKIIEKR